MAARAMRMFTSVGLAWVIAPGTAVGAPDRHDAPRAVADLGPSGEPPASETPPDASETPREDSSETPGEPSSGEPAPSPSEDTPVVEPAHEGAASPTVPEPDPPAAEPTPAPHAEPFPATPSADVRPEPARGRALGLGLLVAGSGFVAIGATTAALYGVTESRCGGSCIGGAIAAAAGVAGVVVGAIVLARSQRRDVAIMSGGRTVARWQPGRGVAF